MKSFLDHLKEEVLPTVQVADGGLDISKPAVRAAINAAIAGVVSQPAVTPYVVFNRLSKLLAQYHIVLPKRFLEGDKGVEVFELRQFGHKMGMTDSGEFVNEVPATHYLFLQYGILSPFGITYAKPVVGGMFKVLARLVDKEELDKLMDMAEITMAEEAEVNQAIAKANAPREEMKDITSDEKIAFQETMDEFVNEVSDLVDFNVLNVYKNNVEWSGKVIDEDLEFIFTIGEDSGIYINGQMVKVDQEFLTMINKLQQFYQKFKSKWGKVLASRKKTKESPQ
jgi:hypothetical protein